MKYGYCRAGSLEQSHEVQVERLVEYGVSEEFILVEKVTGTSREERIELQTLMSLLRSGDTLCCTKLDLLGGSIREVEKIVNQLQEKGFYLVCTEQKIDTRKTTGVRLGRKPTIDKQRILQLRN